MDSCCQEGHIVRVDNLVELHRVQEEVVDNLEMEEGDNNRMREVDRKEDIQDLGRMRIPDLGVVVHNHVAVGRNILGEAAKKLKNYYMVHSTKHLMESYKSKWFTLYLPVLLEEEVDVVLLVVILAGSSLSFCSGPLDGNWSSIFLDSLQSFPCQCHGDVYVLVLLLSQCGL